MKLVILAGGYGTRISEETILKPKPLIEIGNMPIIWHIMKYYYSYGITEFIICLGYKGYLIKEFFSNYALRNSNVSFDMKLNEVHFFNSNVERWKITLIDTGENTMTGGRIKRIQNYVEEDFLMTYGDGLSNVDINELIAFHLNNKKIATLTAVWAPGRFGSLSISGSNVTSFKEKPKGDGSKINGGFFVLNKKIFDYIANDSTIFENEPLINLSNNNQLCAYNHNGFWYAMDTLNDKNYLEKLWISSEAPWKIWR